LQVVALSDFASIFNRHFAHCSIVLPIQDIFRANLVVEIRDAARVTICQAFAI